jgi:short subunit dehydrogenase-like uncharacterized protein
MALPAETPASDTLKLKAGQTKAEAKKEKSKIVAEVTGADGKIARSMIEMPEGYMPTVTASVEIVSRALNGSFRTGFQSPASVYGESLLDTLINVKITDI